MRDINKYIIKDLGQEVCRSIFGGFWVVLSHSVIAWGVWLLRVKVDVTFWRGLQQKGEI